MTSLTLTASARAFGDASHPSTQGALAALNALQALGGVTHMLDLGCGNGILGLTAAQQWGCRVIAADILPEAVAACAENAHANGLADRITALRSDGCAHPAIQAHAPYPLIACNILADTLVRLAPDLTPLLAEEGLLILSGILVWQAEGVIACYSACGLTLLQKITVGDWVTLLWQLA